MFSHSSRRPWRICRRWRGADMPSGCCQVPSGLKCSDAASGPHLLPGTGLLPLRITGWIFPWRISGHAFSSSCRFTCQCRQGLLTTVTWRWFWAESERTLRSGCSEYQQGQLNENEFFAYQPPQGFRQLASPLQHQVVRQALALLHCLHCRHLLSSLLRMQPLHVSPVQALGTDARCRRAAHYIIQHVAKSVLRLDIFGVITWYTFLP